MEKENFTKRMFLILSIMCFVPSLLVLIRGTIFGFGWYLPIAIFLWTASRYPLRPSFLSVFEYAFVLPQ